MMKNLMASACFVLALAACAKKPEPAPAAAPAETATPPALASGIDKANFDAAVRPQDDLYQAIDGTWLKNTPIPADRSNYGSFTKLADDAEAQLRVIIEELSTKTGKTPGSIEQKVGDYYASFMDEAKIEEAGVKPIAPELARVDALKDKKELPALMAEFVRNGVSVPLIPYVHQDAKDSTQYAGDFYQSGLGLPDRDYYLIDDDKFKGIRAAYLAHMQKMFELAGLKDGAQAAKDVLALETQIAKVQWDKVVNRDPVKTYNPYEPAKLATLTSEIDWSAYLSAVGYGSLKQVLVSQPTYVTGLGQLIKATPIATWREYFTWRVLHSRAGDLNKAIVDEDFAFNSKTLNGVQEIRPRWKRGVDGIETSMGEAVGQVYVERHFPAASKARMEALVKNLLKAYEGAIGGLTWMSDDTKKAALVKLSKFTYKIGYPDKWRDYSKLEVTAGDVVGNATRAAAFEYDRNIAKLGKPIDRSEWGMTPQTVNAYYNPEMNEIVFPAAILQPPFFDPTAEDAVNYGGIGAVIGHEISHGFDDQGAQYDGDGNLKNWWSEEDNKKFKALGDALAAQYDGYEPVKGYHVNGHFTLGENIADLGGLTIAHEAYELGLGGQPGPVIDGYTADQRFFMGWAQVWRRNYRDENLLTRLKTDPHSPSEYRCNGVIVNVPAFSDAFAVKEGDKLYRTPEQRIKIW
jgi:putative endopeptidase